MTITYSSTIPNPPDDPADDVAIMQSNAAAISSIISIDHVGFNVAGGGQHKQVTFNSNNVPALPATTPVLFTDLPSNHSGTPTYPQLFFYSGTAAQSQNQYVLTGNGSTVLPGGIIMKWGTYTITAGNTSAAVSFTSAFPNNVFSLAITNSSFSNSTDLLYSYNTLGVSGFNGVRNTVQVTTASYSYIAIGN